MNLNWSYNTSVEKAYIITLKGNETSEQWSKRCQLSCRHVNQPFEVYDAFDGLDTSKDIRIPEHSQNKDWLKWIKQTDKNLSQTEVACALSHISLWIKCIEIDRPIVILEHDAVMIKPFTVYPSFGCIVYLGSKEQIEGSLPRVQNIPPHGTNGPNYHFILRAHAYAIDPIVAKNLVAHVIKYGICESLDIMIRADIFPIIQTDIYAYDKFEGTTIINRKKDINGRER